ncbi:mitochondrial carrier domain-containing protein [Pyronema domesticum]|nr:mitochondrial carrier domain-containing protein [Pyronema domesticum]
MSAEKKSEKPTVLRSLIAGSTAGAIEIAITYPAEFAKTRSQLNQWYAGCTTSIIGNSVKAGVRFLAFDFYKNLLADEKGNVSGPKTVLAGLGAGVTESLLAVTPFESIKTQIIDDRKKKGYKGFLQGFVPTTARQAANSAVRFGSYNAIKQVAQGYVAPGEKLGGVATFGIGATAGLITVYATQPLDSVKTRMQSIEAKTMYRNTLHCAVKLFKEEGVLVFWSGATPRLARLMVSGGLVFTFYEKAIEFFDKIDPEKKYF